jgi:hypothetical protein
MVKGRLLKDNNKDYVELPCGYKIIGNPKKANLLKKLHLSKCEKCDMYMKACGITSLKVIPPNLSEDKSVNNFMRKGENYKTAQLKVLKQKLNEASKKRLEGDLKFSEVDINQFFNITK